jgi:1-acyl-sn-glycerol-3-phosphate acyltransferase
VLKVAWYWFIITLIRWGFNLFLGGIRSKGRENVPKKGPVILASIHISHLDPPALAAVSPRKFLQMAKKELFEKPLFRWLIKSLGAFPVERGATDSSAIRHTIELLKSGEVILIFPEGTRGDGVHLGEIQSGIAMLAKRSGAPVVPVGTAGLHSSLTKEIKKIQRGRVNVHFGTPINYSDFDELSSEKAKRVAFSEELTKQLLQLTDEAGHPLKIADDS